MMRPFAELRILAGRVAGVALVLTAESAATEGWRDKRRGTTARHVVGVDRKLPCRPSHHSAGPHSKFPKFITFLRATTRFEGAAT